MILFSEINWWAVLVGVVATNAFGFLWYGPLFGKQWMNMIGKKPEDIEADPGMYLKTAFASLVTMIVLNLVVIHFAPSGFLGGLILGGMVWLGIGATATFVYTTFEGPPTSVWLLFSIYQFILYLLMGGVFAIW